jgi:hypothetical protein
MQNQITETDDLPSVPLEVMEPLPPTAPADHYHISSDTRNKVQLRQWLKRNESDPALHVSAIYFSVSELNYSLLILGLSSSPQESSFVSSAWAQV